MSQIPYNTVRKVRKKEALRSKKKSPKVTKLFDTFIIATSVVTPILTLPQVWQIWSQHRAQDVSLTTWGAYLGGSLVWLIYGLLHKEKPMIISYGLLIIVNAAIVLGILMYR